MRYELAHDSLARQILERVSGIDKARRQARRLVERAYERYQTRGVLLGQEDLDEIRPHEASIQFSTEEQQFIRESKRALARAARRKRRMLLGIISLLSAFLLFALWQWQRSVAGAKALQAKAAYEDGYVSKAFRLAQSAHRTLGIDRNTRATVGEVLRDIAASGLERDLVHASRVKALAVSTEGDRILSITASPEAYIWDLQGRSRDTLIHPAEVQDGGFLPWTGEWQYLTVAADSSAYFWDSLGTLVGRQSLSGPVLGFDFNAQQKLTLIWSKNEVLLFNDRGEALDFKTPVRELIRASFSPSGSDLLLANRDSVSSWWLQLVKIGRAQPRLVISGAITWTDYVQSDPGQMQILVQFDDSTSQVFDIQGRLDTGSYYSFLNREFERLSPIQEFGFSPAGRANPKVLFLTDSTSLRYWSAYRKDTEGNRIGVIDFYTRYDLAVLNATFSTSGRYLLTASADGRVDIWDIAGGAIQRFKRFRAIIRDAHFVREDNYLISSAFDRTIKIWRIGSIDESSPKALLRYYDERLIDIR